MQSQSFHHAICMRLRPKMMQIAVQYASSCDAWRVYLHFKVASHAHENELFISVWSRRKVLKTRKEVDSSHARKGFRGERNLKVFMG